MTRVLCTTMDFPPTHGGIQTMARQICTRAARLDLHVIAPADHGYAPVDRLLGVTVKRVRSLAPGRRGYVPTIAWEALRAARAWHPQAGLSLHVLSTPGLLLARVPTVVVAHAGEFRSSRIRAIAKQVLPRAARVVANSSFTRTEAIALGADPMRTTVIPVGAPEAVPVPHERVEALRRRFGAGRIILSVSRLEPHKGHDRLIRALGHLPDDVHLVLVGEGSAYAALDGGARELDLAGRVHFAGSVDDDDLPAYYAAADCFALLSRATASGVEGGGIALLEACAYGLPVVAAATGGIPETIRDGDTGLLVEPGEIDAVARALRRVLDDAALAERLRGNARAMATGERSWDAFVRRLEDVVEQVAR